MLTRWPIAAALLGSSVVLMAGCSGRPARVPQPDYAAGAGVAAVNAYDADGDNSIAGEELDRVPALRASLSAVDADSDGRVTADEIEARIQGWRDLKTGQMTARCQVLLDGEPLVGAQVEFEPEPFLGKDVKPASGVTGAGGTAAVSMATEHLSDSSHPGMACGWYKIKVTSNDREIPAKYNTETTLGCEVAPNADWVYEPGEVVLELTSK